MQPRSPFPHCGAGRGDPGFWPHLCGMKTWDSWFHLQPQDGAARTIEIVWSCSFSLEICRAQSSEEAAPGSERGLQGVPGPSQPCSKHRTIHLLTLQMHRHGPRESPLHPWSPGSESMEDSNGLMIMNTKTKSRETRF